LDGEVITTVSLDSTFSQKNTTQLSSIQVISLFIEDNILTALANSLFCSEVSTYFASRSCIPTTRAFIIQFDTDAKISSALTLIKQFDIFNSENFNTNDAKDIRSTGSKTFVSLNYTPFFLQWPFDRCSDEFKNLTEAEYQQEALKLIQEWLQAMASEMVKSLSAGPDGDAQSCENILKVPTEKVPTEMLKKYLRTGDLISFFRFAIFAFDKETKSVQSAIHTMPFFSDAGVPVMYVTEHSTLIALPSVTGEKTLLVKYDLNGSSLTVKAFGSVEGSISSSYDIDFYNGYYRIATGDATNSKLFVLEEKNSELLVIGQVKLDQKLNWVRFAADKGFLCTTKQVS